MQHKLGVQVCKRGDAVSDGVDVRAVCVVPAGAGS
jgi:hypothetical protein